MTAPEHDSAGHVRGNRGRTSRNAPRDTGRPPTGAAAAILGLQRSAGNAAVDRLLDNYQDRDAASGVAGPPPAPATSVQRDTAGAPPTEFVPTVVADPAGPTTLKLFQHQIQSWQIANWRNAPKGTYFHWGWAVEGDNMLRLVADDTKDNDATKLISVQARKPGPAKIQGTPVHQVPGGPQMTGDVRRVPITVTPPTLNLLSLMPRKADGSGGNLDHLSVGDKIIARVEVGNVDADQLEDPSVVGLGGTGVGNVEVGTWRRAQKLTDGATYDVELNITRPAASLNLTVELGLGDITLGQGAKASGIHGEVEMDRQEFLNAASLCGDKIEQAYTRANSVFEVLCAAYGNAYDAYDNTLKAQDASNNLLGDIVLNAALAFIPGGVGGVVGAFMKNGKAGDFLADGVKDLAKAGARGIENAAVGGGRIPSGAAMKPMADDPRSWRAQQAVQKNTEKEKVLSELIRWKSKALASAPDFFLNFDPVATMDNALDSNGQPLKDIPVPDQAEHERLFELGMWKEWLSTSGYTVSQDFGYYGPEPTVKENQGKKIRDRINKLGEDGDAWLEQYGGISKAKAEEEEAARRNAARGKFF